MTPKAKCLKVWNYIKDNPGVGKDEAYVALGFEKNAHTPLSMTCEACAVAAKAWMEAEPDDETRSIMDMCNYCPVGPHWPTEDGEFILGMCEGDDFMDKSAYNRWSDENDTIDPDEEVLTKMASLVIQTVETYWVED